MLAGPVLRATRTGWFASAALRTRATLDGGRLRPGKVVLLAAGSVLDVGPIDGPGMRGYLAIEGGLDVPRVLGSRATFILGEFGGHGGSAACRG